MDMELHQNWALTGSDLNEFYEGLRYLTEHTRTTIVSSSMDLGIFAVVTSGDENDIVLAGFPNRANTGGRELVTEDYERWAKSLIDANKRVGKLQLFGVQNAYTRFLPFDFEEKGMRGKIGDKAYEEMVEQSKLLLSYNGRMYPVSPIAYTTLLARAALGGESMTEPHYGRAVELARQLHHKRPTSLTLVTRENDTDGRVLVAAHSGKYAYLPQTVLIEMSKAIIDGLGEMKGESWHIDHTISDCWAVFPEIADDISEAYPGLPEDVQAGLYIAASDTGNSSIIIRGFWKIGDHKVMGEEVKRSHRGDPDLDALVEATKETIFNKYLSLPDRLMELLAKDVADPKKMVRAVFKETKIGRVIGRKRKEALMKAMDASFVAGAPYTAYDIAMLFLSIPEHITGLSDMSQADIVTACSKAVFAKCLLSSKSAPADDEEDIL